MQRKVILASHGSTAAGLFDSMEMIVGKNHPEIMVYSLHPGENATDFANLIKKEITSHSDTEFIILTDLYGASVCSSMYALLGMGTLWLFSGMNLNMLLAVCLEYPQPLKKEDAEKIVDDARQGIRWVEKQEVENDDF